MDVLIVRAPMYHSLGDEAAFLTWLKRIRAVQSAQLRGADIHISLRAGKVSSDELREFRALFHRYGLDTSALMDLERR
ncbi:hypothetical protein [Phenylobacterium sp.]|uniref:hypothetical protein n=1 Tax=Phenylobacterium sp. TaxID=1871053 RepID=UPI0025E537A3|nr:hypothetical protein [Phenylobacterium sp.]